MVGSAHPTPGDITTLKTSKPRTQNPEPKTRQQKPKTVFSISLGCPKNLVDTEIMLGGLTNAGWEVTGDARRRRSSAGQYLRLH